MVGWREEAEGWGGLHGYAVAGDLADGAVRVEELPGLGVGFDLHYMVVEG